MEHVDSIIQEGTVDALLSIVESEELEVKAEPYDLGAASGRYELAKDVSATYQHWRTLQVAI